MSEPNSQDTETSQNSTENKDEKPFNLINFDSDRPSKKVFEIFGYEFIAPSGMNNPALIYLLFVIVNLTIFIFLKAKL
tara:strand:- start:282 stop:515 length:234 start_codon:yes stop_codon:yes gene_type:complete